MQWEVRHIHDIVTTYGWYIILPEAKGAHFDTHSTKEGKDVILILLTKEKMLLKRGGMSMVMKVTINAALKVYSTCINMIPNFYSYISRIYQHDSELIFI